MFLGNPVSSTLARQWEFVLSLPVGSFGLEASAIPCQEYMGDKETQGTHHCVPSQVKLPILSAFFFLTFQSLRSFAILSHDFVLVRGRTWKEWGRTRSLPKNNLKETIFSVCSLLEFYLK